jgi:sulfur-oxidizing protein SoxA
MMKRLTAGALATAALATFVTAAWAQDSASIGEDGLQTEPMELVIDDQKLITRVKAPAGSPFTEIISGWEFRNPGTRKMELDDFDNPAFIWVDQGETLWSSVDGTQGKSCQSCHDNASKSMRGVRASFPKWSEARGKPKALEHQVNECRTERMGAEAWKWESDQMLGMTAYVGLQSRGMPVQVQTDGPMQDWLQRGKDLYYSRIGQLDMSCANCHEDNYGKMIRADRLSQGQVNGFPTYRLKWQKIGSLHRRFKGCMENIRAVAYDRGSDEFTALELYVASRGQGLSVETPAVRQ